MKHDQLAFAAATQAYADATLVEDRVRRFLPLVRKAAWHIHGSGCEGIEPEDLVQIGLLALTECAQRHTGPAEDGFAAYAKIRVRGAMLDAIRRSLPGSRGALVRQRRMTAARDRLHQTLGMEPTGAQMAQELGIAEADLADYTCEPVRLQALDKQYDDNNTAFADQRPDPFEALSQEQDGARLAALIGALPERLKLVLQLYFVEELNLAEIAAVISVSIPRVHQLKAQAIKLVREGLEGACAD